MVFAACDVVGCVACSTPCLLIRDDPASAIQACLAMFRRTSVDAFPDHGALRAGRTKAFTSFMVFNLRAFSKKYSSFALLHANIVIITRRWKYARDKANQKRFINKYIYRRRAKFSELPVPTNPSPAMKVSDDGVRHQMQSAPSISDDRAIASSRTDDRCSCRRSQACLASCAFLGAEACRRPVLVAASRCSIK